MGVLPPSPPQTKGIKVLSDIDFLTSSLSSAGERPVNQPVLMYEFQNKIIYTRLISIDFSVRSGKNNLDFSRFKQSNTASFNVGFTSKLQYFQIV